MGSDKRDILRPWSPERVRQALNAYEPYAGARIEITEVAPDASEIRVQMPLVEANANLVGTHFGGSLYAMVDPHLMILLMVRLGDDYVVWDRGASIEFLKPGLGTVHATICVTEAEVESIREATRDAGKHQPVWSIDILDEGGEVVARVAKTLYVRRRRSR